MNFNFNPANKYRNKKVELDGIVFDSKKESRIYLDLKALKDNGEIKVLELQKRFELIPAQYEMSNGKRGKCIERAVFYIADFYVEYADGEVVVIDAKGMRPASYTIKRKLMLYVLGIKVKEV